MGSLPTQGSKNNIISSNIDEALVLTTIYVNKLIIDSRNIGDSVITIYNSDAGASVHYKIYASSKETNTVPSDGDNNWVNIIDRETDDPSLYDHNKERIIPPLGTFYESFSNKWSWVRIMMKTSAGVTNAKIWHRGTK